MEDEKNWSYIGGGDTYQLRSWSHFSTIQYVKKETLYEDEKNR